MCETCGDEIIYHVKGERSISREHCACRCHDQTDERGHLLCSVPRDDLLGAITACEKCRWAHVVAFSTKNWRDDERYMQPPLGAPRAE